MGCLATGLPRRLHVDLGGAGGSSGLAKMRRDQRDHEVGESVFLALHFWFQAFPWHRKKKKHTCTRQMSRLFMFCFWPGARWNSLVTLALLGHYL